MKKNVRVELKPATREVEIAVQDGLALPVIVRLPWWHIKKVCAALLAYEASTEEAMEVRRGYGTGNEGRNPWRVIGF